MKFILYWLFVTARLMRIANALYAIYHMISLKFVKIHVFRFQSKLIKSQNAFYNVVEVKKRLEYL